MASIDIILPVYNVSTFINKCLRSIACQTFTDFKLIIVDDCGNDDSMAICKGVLQKTNIDYQIIENENNLGLSESRNRGILNSNSPYILHIDSDDWIHESILEKLYCSAINNDANIVSCRGLQYWECSGEYSKMAETESGTYTSPEYLDLLFNGETSSHICLRLFKRNLFDTVKFPANVIFEDVLTLPILIQNANKIIQLEDALYFYRQRNSKTSITGSRPTNIEGFIYCLKALELNFLNEDEPKNLLFRKFTYKILFYIVFNILQYSKNYIETKSELKAITTYLNLKYLTMDIFVLKKSMKVNSILYLMILKINKPILFYIHKKVLYKWFH